MCVCCLWAKLKNKSSSLIITWLITFYEITVNNTESVDFLIGFSVSITALCVCLLQLYTFTYVEWLTTCQTQINKLTELVTCIISI